MRRGRLCASVVLLIAVVACPFVPRLSADDPMPDCRSSSFHLSFIPCTLTLVLEDGASGTATVQSLTGGVYDGDFWGDYSAYAPTVPPPAGWSFPFGVLELHFRVVQTPPGFVTITIEFPQPFGAGAFAYWKLDPSTNTWVQMPGTQVWLSSDRTTVILTLMDNHYPDDTNLVDPGSIYDPGAPAIAHIGAPVGGLMEPVNKLSIIAPYMVLLGVILAVTVIVCGTRRTWKTLEENE